MRKKLSIIMIAITVFLSFNSVVLAENSAGETSNIITTFHYTVYDSDGEVIETGVIPNRQERMMWKGITLSNGHTAHLRTELDKPFYIRQGTNISFKVSLNRMALAQCYLKGPVIIGSTDSRNLLNITVLTQANVSGDYEGIVTNLSSDPITITSASLEF